MASKTYLRSIVAVVAAVVISVYASITFAQESDKEEQPFLPIIKTIETAGEYNFIAQIEQTLIPRPLPINVGTTEQQVDSQMSGRVVLPDYAEINLQFESEADLPPISIEQEGTAVYLVKDGERTPIENPLSISPTTDFLAFFEAAENLREVENPDQPQLTVYQFEISGQKFGEMMVDRLEEQLPPAQQGAQLSAPENMTNMSGTGEIWVDADGYPQRQILDIHMPEANEQFDAQSRIVIDYEFQSELNGVALPTAGNIQTLDSTAAGLDGSAAAIKLAPISSTELYSSFTYTLLSLLLILLVILLIAAVFYVYPYRWLRSVMPFALVVLMVGIPVLEPISAVYGAARNLAAAPPSLAEALGFPDAEAEAVDASDSDFEQAVSQPASPQAQATANNPIACGTGSTTTDTDRDGTTDFVENCLGTSPLSLDTDLDGITDTLEISGFVFTDTQNITHTIYTNPQEFDSNQDGLDDLSEWAVPIGTAPSHDPDGDNVPNIWDDDNDGDGIKDRDDIDPFSVSAYRSDFAIRTGLNGSSFDGYQYIEFQVQPQNQSRYQLLTTELDWPYDDKGSIRARDVSRTDELTFTPMLKIETNTIPERFWRNNYGVTVIRQGGTDYMYVDLSPVSNGGEISAFYGKVAYTPFEIADINWSKIELVWTAFMKHSPHGEPDSSKFVTYPVAEYVEPAFRFAGLEVSKNGSMKYALMGTPNNQTDHRQLVNLLTGLDASFLSTLSPDFDTIVSRLSSPTTPISQTWGIPVSDIAVRTPLDQPPHIDAALISPWDSYTNIQAFLTENNYSTSQYASIVMVTEAIAGSGSLDTGDAEINGKTFTFNLGQVSLFTTRNVVLNHYEHNGTGWRDVDDLTAINQMIQRYPGDPAAAVTTLRQSYPQINEIDLGTLLLAFYTHWAFGQSAVVSVDGFSMVKESEDIEALYAQIGSIVSRDTLVYLVEAYRLGTPGGSVKFNDPGTYQEFQNSTRSSELLFGLAMARTAYSIVLQGNLVRRIIRDGVIRQTNTGLTGFYGLMELKANGFVKLAEKAGRGQRLSEAAFAVENLGRAYSPLKRAVVKNGVTVAWKDLTFTKWRVNSIKAATKFAKASKLLGRIAIFIDVVFTVVYISKVWANFGKYKSPYGYENTYAAIYATVTTITSIIYLILGLSGIGIIIVLILSIIDFIGQIASKSA
ncbi:MAG: hypothetical protein AAF633_20135, partial [Chloroflexota bacterium]